MEKICICVSGQMRASSAGLESLKRALDGRDATVIFSVWNRFGRKTAGAINVHQLGRIFSADAVLGIPSRWVGWKAFSEALPNLFPQNSGNTDESESVREHIKSFFPNAIIDIEDDGLLDLSFDDKKEDSNSIRMLYKMWRANEIKRKVESVNGKFEVVFRVRPDTLLNKIDTDLINNSDSKNIVFVNDFIPGGRFVGDTFAAASSQAMDIYVSLFGHALRDRSGWSFIHTEIHDHLVRHGLSYAKYPYYGNLAADQTLTAREVADHLADPASAPLGGDTPLHRITRVAMLASADLADKNSSGALAHLRRIPSSESAKDYDGCLAVLGAVLLAESRPFDAICCWLIAKQIAASFTDRDPNTFYMQRLQGVVMDCLIQHADSESAADLTPLADRIASRMAVLSQEFAFLSTIVPSTEASQEMQANFLAFVRDGSLGEVVANRIARLPKDAGTRNSLLRVAEWIVVEVNAMYNIAQKLKEVRLYKQALFWQERAINLDPKHPGAQRQMAELCFHVGDVQGGLRHANEAFRLGPEIIDIVILKKYARFIAGLPTEVAQSNETADLVPPGDFLLLPRFDEFIASKIENDKNYG